MSVSCPEALVLTHQLRAFHDAILVGIGTMLSDRPRLNVRLVEGSNPRPVLLDSHLRIADHPEILAGRPVPLIVAALEAAEDQRERTIKSAGHQVVRLPGSEEGWVSLRHLLGWLARSGISTLMVEGGARVITSFLSGHLVDRAVITINPTIVGGLQAAEGLARRNGWHNGAGLEAGRVPFPRVADLGYRQVGSDLVVWGWVQ